MKGGNLRIEKLMEIDSRSQVEVTIEEPLPEGYVSVAEGPLKIQGGLLRVVPNGSVDLTAGRHEFLFAQAKWIKGEFDTVEFPKGEAKWDIQYKQDRTILVAVVED